MNRLVIIFALVLGTMMATAQPFSYSCELESPSKLWHSIELPPKALGAVQPNYADVRIIGIKENGDTIQAPYVVEYLRSFYQQVEVAQRLINISHNEEAFFATLKMKTDKSYNQLHVDFQKQNYDFLIDLEGSNDQQNWVTVAQDLRVVSVTEKGKKLTVSTLGFPACNFAYLRLKMNTSKDPLLARAVLKFIQEENGQEVQARSSFKVTEKEKASWVEINLNSKLPIEKLELSFKDTLDYFRSFSVAIADDFLIMNKDTVWQFRHVFSGTLNSWRKSKIAWRDGRAKKIQMIIDNGDNKPLSLLSAKAFYSKVILKARFTEEAHYLLAYGNPKLQSPRYDIVNFQDQIPQSLTQLRVADCTEVKKIENEIKEENPFEYEAIIWVALILIGVLLAYFTLKLLK